MLHPGPRTSKEISVINNVIAKVFGTANERAVKKLLPTLSVIAEL